ncbi:MAG: CHASE domain-containing protein [Chloroflexota bacterium]
MSGSDAGRRLPSLNAVILLFAFSTILIATVSAWLVVDGTNRRAALDRLGSDTAETAALYQRLTSAVTLAPTAVSGLVTTVDNLDRNRFNAFSGPLIDEQVLVSVRWVPYVPGSRRDAFELMVRQGGQLDFSITDRLADGSFATAPARGDYYPVLFSEPVTAEDDIIGFDLGSSDVRRVAIEHARDTGRFVVTPPIALSAGGRGALVVVPTYSGGATPLTVDERRAAFMGVAVGVFRPQELLLRATSRLSGEDLSFTIEDLGPADEPRLPADRAVVVATRASSIPSSSGQSTTPSTMPSTIDVPFGERAQVLEVTPGLRYLERGTTSPLPIVLTAFASLAAVGLYAVQRRRFEQALGGAAARLRSVLSASPDAFVGLDEHGRVVDWSEQATRLFGMPRAQALGRWGAHRDQFARAGQRIKIRRAHHIS